MILASGLAVAQSLPDAPSPQPSATCGPSWLGGCWDIHQPQLGYGETFKSPSFYVPFFGLLAANAIDIEATRASGCGEAHDFGRKPSRLSQYGQDFAADAAVGALAFFMKRAHFKVIPETMLMVGIGIHARGAVRGFQANCR